MKQLQQHNQIEKIIQKKFFEGDLHPLLWRAKVVEIDTTGSVFDNQIPGSLKVRILGLHDYIDVKDEKKLLPVALPLFFQSGFKPNIPEVGDEIFCQFEYFEPVGQLYWLTICPLKQKELK